MTVQDRVGSNTAVTVSRKFLPETCCMQGSGTAWQNPGKKRPRYHDRSPSKKQDLAAILFLKGQAPSMIFLPPRNLSHIPGSLDPVASHAEDLEIIPGPLVTAHGDGPDVVQDAGMMPMRIPRDRGFIDLPAAAGTFPSLFITDNPSQTGNRGSPFEIILQGAGSLAADRVLVSRGKV